MNRERTEERNIDSREGAGRIAAWKKALWIVLLAALVCLPLAAPGLEGRFGQDLGFHLMRIEGIAEGLENGVFPVKMQSLWMEGYGYPVSVYYGDFLLYLPALLRLCGVPVVAAYKIFVALVNLGTGLLALYSFRKIFGDDRVALVCAAAYLTAGYRLLNLYVRAAAGEYCAMMFLPLLAAAVWEIYRGKPDSIRERFSMATLLALAVSGLIGTHLLTTEMAGVVLLIVGLIFWKRTFSREVFPTLALACGETALLNLYFLAPFLDYYLHVPVYLNRVMEGVKQIQEDGASLWQLLAFWASPFQRGDASTHLIATPGPLLLAVLVAGLILLLWKKRGLSRQTLFFWSASLALLLVSTCCFPWDFLAKSSSVGRFLAQVQFPWRYVGPAALFLTLTLGSLFVREFSAGRERMGGRLTAAEKTGNEGVGEKGRSLYRLFWIAAFLCVFQSLLFAGQYVRGYEPVFYSQRQDLDTYDMGMIEYLRYPTEREELTGEPAGEGMDRMEILSRRGTTTVLFCAAGDDGGTVDAPVLNYPGYHVVDEEGNEYNIRDGENNVIRFDLPAGFFGEITIRFTEPWYWRAGELLSLAALAVIAVGAVVMRRRRQS